MGIYKKFDEAKQKWYWEGFGFRKYYNSEAECNADKENVWNKHINKVKAFGIVSKLLTPNSRHYSTY